MLPEKNKKYRVAIYSGSIPSTTFIERLIVAMADNGHHIIINGRRHGKVSYNQTNIRSIGFQNELIGILKSIFFSIGLIIKWPLALQELWKQRRQFSDSRSFVRHYIRIAPILYYKPEIFHLQWAKEVEQWMWLRILGIKLVVSLRGTHISISPLSNPMLAETYRKLFPLLDGFHAVCKSLAEKAIYYGALQSKVKVVYSGLDLDAMQFLPSIGKSYDKLKIISIGRSHWLKGYRTSMDACSALKKLGVDFHYTIIGGLAEELIFLRHQSNLENEVTLKAALHFDEVKRELLESDLLILPSYEEGIANVVLEAMALGVPVISTHCGGMPEVIQNDENGWLVSVRNPTELSETIINFKEMKAESVNRIILNGRTTIEKKFELKQMAAGMEELYQNAMRS